MSLYHRQRFVSPLLHFHACIVHLFVFILMKGKCGKSSGTTAGCWALSVFAFLFFLLLAKVQSGNIYLFLTARMSRESHRHI